MTVPARYHSASRDFERLLVDLRETSGLTSSPQVYTMLQGVLQAFRSRLTLEDAIRFANVLPPLVRALFVADWNPEATRRPFEDRDRMTRDAQSLRPGHNFAPDSCIRDVARAVRRHVVEPEFDACLAALPEGAIDFWTA